jgi:hypothetical protein
LNGITGWLFGELRDANINPPADLSFSSILGFVLEVLGITVERIWQKLAERIGQERVDRIRGMIDRLTGIWTFVKDVVTRGPVAIWEYIQERLSNLWDTVLEAVRNWVVTRIVQRVTARLLSMLDPTGIMAVVNGFIAFYNAVQSFIRYLREMLEIVNSFVVGVAELARGNVMIAANYLENSLASAMPVAIGFLANQVGLSGIGRRIGEMIERVRALVDRALTWLVDRAVSAGTSFLNMARSALGLGGGESSEDQENAPHGDWRDEEGTFNEDGVEHEVSFNGTDVMVASRTPRRLQDLRDARIAAEADGTRGEWAADKRSAYQAAAAIRPQIPPLTEQFSQAQMNGQDTTSIETQIQQKLQQMAGHLQNADLFIEEEAENNLPPTNVTPAPSGGRAGTVTANPLTKIPGNTQGSNTSGSENIPGAGVTTHGTYDRVHLLSAALHGPATNWNLAMGSRSSNSRLEGGPESKADQKINQNKVLSYRSRVNYWSGLTPAWKNDFARSFTVSIEYFRLRADGNGVERDPDESTNPQTFGPYESIEPTGPGTIPTVPLPRIPGTVDDIYALADELNNAGYTYAAIAREFNNHPAIVAVNGGREVNVNTIRGRVGDIRRN